MRKSLIKYAFFTFFISTTTFAQAWQTIKPGFKFKALSSRPHARIYAFKINPLQYQFSIMLGKPTAYVADLAKGSQPLLAINGGFFSVDAKPLGLRISNYQVLSPLKKINWWGIFYIEGHKPRIQPSNHFRLSSRIAFAVEAGPRLLINGKIPQFKPGVAQRSAIGISQDHEIIIAVTDYYALSLTEWAQVLKKDFGCVEALNLDGGGSSQLYTQLPQMKLNVTNFNPVTDAVVVSDRR